MDPNTIDALWLLFYLTIGLFVLGFVMGVCGAIYYRYYQWYISDPHRLWSLVIEKARPIRGTCRIDDGPSYYMALWDVLGREPHPGELAELKKKVGFK